MFLWICSVAAVLGGAAIVLTSLPDAPWGRLDPSPLAGGVALGAVGITSGIALVTSASFTSQRKLATEALLRDQRAAVYRDTLAGMIRAFTNKKLPDIAKERATVAMWASPASIVAFEKWFTYAWNNRGEKTLAEKPYMYSLFGDCIERMRFDLGIDVKKSTVNRHALMQMIFVDYGDEMINAHLLLTETRPAAPSGNAHASDDQTPPLGATRQDHDEPRDDHETPDTPDQTDDASPHGTSTM